MCDLKMQMSFFLNTLNMDEMHISNTLPIVVGGTNYYIESLLWKVLLDSGVSTTQTHVPSFLVLCASLSHRITPQYMELSLLWGAEKKSLTDSIYILVISNPKRRFEKDVFTY